MAIDFDSLRGARQVDNAVLPGYLRYRTGGNQAIYQWYHSRVRKTVYLSLGSNLGDRVANLESAITRLGALGTLKAISSFCETEPVGPLTQPWFLNCAVALETDRLPRQLLSAVLRIEREMGRRRTVLQGPRSIDIDILLFSNALVDTAELTIPHPALHERRFVLEPMVEIAPDVRHPVFKKTMRELRDALPKAQQLRKVKSG